MLNILSILAIFSFIIVLFIASLKIIDLIFTAQINFKPKHIKKIFTATSLVLWFSFSLISTLLAAEFLVKIPQTFLGNSLHNNSNLTLALKDCQKLIDAIYLGENKIYQIENHRYIEEEAPIFTIKLEYTKGAKQLQSVANRYLKLDVAENSQQYSNQIAQKLQEKAQLFQHRTEIKEDSQGVEEILNLLRKMDRVTAQRQSAIDAVKQQCKTNI